MKFMSNFVGRLSARFCVEKTLLLKRAHDGEKDEPKVCSTSFERKKNKEKERDCWRAREEHYLRVESDKAALKMIERCVK